jgi:hypothetical protein
MGNHRCANHLFLPVHASCEPCQVQRLFRKVGYTAYFGVNYQNLELEGDGRPGISRVISSSKSRAEALHIDSSFVEPNAWIVDMENCRRHNLHLAVDGQSQRCSLIPAARPCDNCLRQSRATSLQPPPVVANAQGTGDCAHLFHERGSYIFDEFSSICYS